MNSKNTTYEHRIFLTEVPYLFFKYPKITVLFFILVIFLEIWFYYFPPQGWEVTTTIHLGEVEGRPICDFQTLWFRMTLNDALMTSIMKTAGFKGENAELLKILNSQIRPKLSYTILREKFVKISLRSSTKSKSKEFLVFLTHKLLTELKQLATKNISKRRREIIQALRYNFEKLKLLQTLLSTKADRINNSIDQNSNDQNQVSSNNYKSFSSWPIFHILVNYLTFLLEDLEYKFINVWYKFSDFDTEIKGEYAKPQIISDEQSPPVPVNPNSAFILILIPFASLFLFTTILLFIDSEVSSSKTDNLGLEQIKQS